DAQAPEPRGGCPLHERERRGSVLRDERGGARAERGGDGALRSGNDLEGRERERLPLLGERPRGRWNPFPLREGRLERREALAAASASAARSCGTSTAASRRARRAASSRSA